jgi:hypothetical protein
MVSGGPPAVFGEVELLLAVIFVDFAAPERYIYPEISPHHRAAQKPPLLHGMSLYFTGLIQMQFL